MFLRTVLAVIVGTVVLIFAASACRADDEKSVAEAIRKAGGTVKVDEKAPDKPVVFVDFNVKKSKKLTDEEIAKLVPQLAAFTNLRRADFGRRKISDTTLQLICKTLPDLQE